MGQPNECVKCGVDTGKGKSRYCNDCNFLLGHKCNPVDIKRRQELGVLYTPLDKQLSEPIPFVRDVENWPEVSLPAKPKTACYNRGVDKFLD